MNHKRDTARLPTRLFVLSLGLASAPALAQPGLGQLAASPGTPAPEQSAASAQTATGATGIQDIVVTAEKRSVIVQRAPAAITVVAGTEIESRGIVNMQQAQVLAPSIHLGQEGGSTQAFIRGVGLTHDSVNIEPQVAINFNGIYIPREGTGGPNLFDVQAMEVLPGPQGTLYGRSATGGVINVNFRRPGHDFGGEIQGEAGNFDLVHVNGALNLPLSKAVRFRVAANYTRQDGYMRSGSGDEKDFGIRASTIIDATDRLSVYLWGSYVTRRGSVPNSVQLPYTNPSDPYNDIIPPFLVSAFNLEPSTRQPMRQTSYLTGGQIDYKADGFTLTYLPGYVDIEMTAGQAGAGSRIDYAYKITQQSNELRFSSRIASRLDLLVGLYQFNQVYKDYIFDLYTPTIPGVPFRIYDIPVSKEYGVAAYAQGIYSLSDSVRVTLGGRYSSTRRRARFNEFLSPFASVPQTFKETYNHLDWKIGAEADIGPRSMAYAAVQTGYNPGTFNTSPSLPLLPRGFRPTRLTAYTAGVKNRFFDNRLQFNVEGFYYDYRDLLISAFNVLTGQEVVQNAKKVRIYGAQVDTKLALSRTTDIYGSVGYLRGKNVDFVIPQVFGPPVDLTGLTPPYSPRWTLNLGLTQTIPLAGGAKLVGQVDSHHESSSYSQFDQAGGTYIKPYWKTDLSLTYFSPGERFSAGAWARNIEDTAHVATASSTQPPLLAAGILDRPRTYGVRVGYRF